jgi:hypothetical protein
MVEGARRRRVRCSKNEFESVDYDKIFAPHMHGTYTMLTSDSSKAFNFFSPCGAETGGAAEEDEAGTTFKEETRRNKRVRNVEVFSH